MTATEKLEMVTTAIGAGKTVYFVTHTNATKITPKTWARFEAAGRPVVKVSASGSLRLAEGKGYVSADFCSIRVAE